MYILINYIKYYGGKSTMAYENFKELKEVVIDTLDKKGWEDKENVDLRSTWSCIQYLCRDAWNVEYKKSTSYKKFTEYRYGEKARAL